MRAARILRHARRSAGMSQRALARAAGVPQSTVGRIEAAQLTPRWDTLDRLLRAAGHSVVVERAAGAGIDRTQFRDLLRLTPRERLRLSAADARGLQELDRLAATLRQRR